MLGRRLESYLSVAVEGQAARARIGRDGEVSARAAIRQTTGVIRVKKADC
jgi:hypothetical protein